MIEKEIDVQEIDDALREMVTEAELTGRKTIFTRRGRGVAMILSRDEYLALRETLDISNDAELRERLARAEEEIRRGKVLAMEDLLLVE